MIWTPYSLLFLGACILFGYLLGSVNFAIIVTRLFGKGDIRSYGSGNAGMTNVLRTVGKAAAVLTLLGDFSKGIISVLVLRLIFPLLFQAPAPIEMEFLVAYAALLGHVFPLYYGFKGGKGILVSAGAMLILSPWSLLICLVVFLAFAAVTRYISVGSIAAGVAYPLALLVVRLIQTGALDWTPALMALPISILVIGLHRANIQRLLQHTESKVSFKKK